MAQDSYTIWERIVDKLMSARFLIAVITTMTLCVAVIQLIRIIGLENADKELLNFRKEIFLYVMGVFSGIAGSVISSYFSRGDRKDKSNGGQQ